LARTGESFDGIARSISWDRFAAVEYCGSAGFPIINPLDHIDHVGKYCPLVSASEGRMVRLVPRKDPSLPCFFIEEINLKKNLCFFRFPVRFRFESNLYTYESKKGE
jgi:hypothetical protein